MATAARLSVMGEADKTSAPSTAHRAAALPRNVINAAFAGMIRTDSRLPAAIRVRPETSDYPDDKIAPTKKFRRDTVCRRDIGIWVNPAR